MSSGANSELESFRQQWQEEVLRRGNGQPSKTRPTHIRTGSKESVSKLHPVALSSSKLHANQDEGDYGTYDLDDIEPHEESRKVTDIRPESIPNHEPISALDHYELAVVRESEGKLGESLDLYRKAFRLDDCVDQTYKKKYFPTPSVKPRPIEARRPSSPVAKVKDSQTKDLTVSPLVASFAAQPIYGTIPIISGDISPPCPIKNLPIELLIDILKHVARADVASLSRLAQVSKRLAYLVSTQDSIWKLLVHGSQFGLGGMHHTYSREISGSPLPISLESALSNLSLIQPQSLPLTLTLNTAYPTYKHMFRHRPRIRFSGVYISTVNYTRPGASSSNTLTWNTPIHVVTYYRYLRFHRDGTCISLLTTTEPLEVVPYLRRENLGSDYVRSTVTPVGVMRDARRGRWKLAPPMELTTNNPKPDPNTSTDQQQQQQQLPLSPKPTATPSKPNPTDPSTTEPGSILTIQTEGPNSTYQYTARFELQSQTHSGVGDPWTVGARNTKLVWRGFWSFNLLTGDWAEFGLRNDRAFVWSRVRSWGEE